MKGTKAKYIRTGTDPFNICTWFMHTTEMGRFCNYIYVKKGGNGMRMEKTE